MTVIPKKNTTKSNLSRLTSLILATGFLIFSVAIALANDHIHYVDADATAGSKTGTSWTNAFTDLQDALDVAVAGEEVWVANGVYRPSKRSVSDKEKSVTFELIEGVKIYGGFAGGETSIDDRDWDANLTVLSGDLENNDTNVNINDGVTTHFDFIQGSNAYNVVIGNNNITYTNATVLDGFTITGGQTEGGGGEAGISDGPGIRFFDGNSPILRNLHVIGHDGSDDGGGIYFHDNNDPVLENITVENTSANDFGAGIMFFNDNNPTFKKVSVIGTEGRYAAGIYLHERNTAEFVNFYACGNISTSSSPNGNGNAGTALSFASDNVIQVSNAAFAANVAGEHGGAIRMRGSNDVTLTNVTMSGNQATNGGGIYIKEAGNTLTIANSILWGNDDEIDEAVSASINTSYSIVGDGSAPSGTGNVTSASSPFIDEPTAGADATWGTEDDTCGNLEIDESSNGLDAGSNAALQADRLDIDNDDNTAEPLPLDLNNQPRLFVTTVDMGAYEFSSPRADQTITFASPADNVEKLINETVELQASSSSNLPVTFENLTTSICTLSGTEVTLNSAGSCDIRASQAGNADYNPAPEVTKTILVSKLAQEISFTAPADMSSAAPAQVIDLQAVAPSGLSVTFTVSPSNVCAITGGGQSAEMLAIGTCLITASQAGDDEYSPAPSVTHSVLVNKFDQEIDFSAPVDNGSVIIGQQIDLQAVATSGLDVTFATNTPSICSVSDETAEMIALGSCTITTSQAGNDSYNAAASISHTITVISKLDQTIEITSPDGSEELNPGDILPLSGTATSGLPVSFSSSTPSICVIAGGSTQMLNYGACIIFATQAGNDRYNPAPDAEATIDVKRDQALVFPNPPALQNVTVGDTLTLAATADSGLEITYRSTTPLVCRVNGNSAKILGSGTCTIEADQGGDDDWFAAPTQSLSFIIEQTTFTIFLPVVTR